MGLLKEEPEKWFKEPVIDVSGWSHEKIETAISAREEARRVKNFAEADRIRDELESNGVVLEDSTTGTEWKRSQ